MTLTQRFSQGRKEFNNKMGIKSRYSVKGQTGSNSFNFVIVEAHSPKEASIIALDLGHKEYGRFIVTAVQNLDSCVGCQYLSELSQVGFRYCVYPKSRSFKINNVNIPQSLCPIK